MAKAAPRRARKTTTRAKRSRKAATPRDLGIEEAWRYIDRLCRAVWFRHMETEAPSSLADIIIALRDEEILPAHEANMMHTVRSLRNLLVHENLEFGEHETAIARAAWHIIRAWAEAHEAEAWRLATTVCRERAA